MPSTRNTLMSAIDRWAAAGLVDPDLAERLRSDVEARTERDRTRWSQFILAGTGAVVLIIAASVFLGWAWPSMGEAARVYVLVVVGLGLKALGIGLERRDRRVPASYLMQTSGLVIILVAVGYSERAWPDASPGAIAIGLIGLGIPLVTAWTSVRRNPVMPAVHTALGYAFLGLFLSRAIGLAADEIVWILDGVLLLSVAVLLLRIRASGEHEGDSGWALNAFVASLYAGLVLVFLTAVGPLDMSDDAVLALDLCSRLVASLTLWAVHRAPAALQRSWYEGQLAWMVALGTVFAFATGSVLDLSDPMIAAVVALFGVAWLVYALPRGSRSLIVTACLALVSAAWFLGIEEAGALGAVLALGFTGGLLFWVSARVGKNGAAA